MRSMVVLPDWRVEEKLYMSLVPSCLGSGVVREGEVAGDCLDRLLVGEAVCCLVALLPGGLLRAVLILPAVDGVILVLVLGFGDAGH